MEAWKHGTNKKVQDWRGQTKVILKMQSLRPFYFLGMVRVCYLLPDHIGMATLHAVYPFWHGYSGKLVSSICLLQAVYILVFKCVYVQDALR